MNKFSLMSDEQLAVAFENASTADDFETAELFAEVTRRALEDEYYLGFEIEDEE